MVSQKDKDENDDSMTWMSLSTLIRCILHVQRPEFGLSLIIAVT